MSNEMTTEQKLEAILARMQTIEAENAALKQQQRRAAVLSGQTDRWTCAPNVFQYSENHKRHAGKSAAQVVIRCPGGGARLSHSVEYVEHLCHGLDDSEAANKVALENIRALRRSAREALAELATHPAASRVEADRAKLPAVDGATPTPVATTSASAILS